MINPDDFNAGGLCDVSLCSLVNCQNGGTCDNGVCSCASGYTGVHCDDVTQEINPVAGEVTSDDGGVSSMLSKKYSKTTKIEKH